MTIPLKRSSHGTASQWVGDNLPMALRVDSPFRLATLVCTPSVFTTRESVRALPMPEDPIPDAGQRVHLP